MRTELICSPLVDRSKLLIVHVRRSLDAATASGVRDKHIPSYCDGTEAGVRAMLGRYAEMAQWHVDHLDVPSITIDYEQLVGQPQQTIAGLGAFLGIDNPRRLRRAVKVVGAKRSLLLTTQLYRYCVRAPQRLFYTCTGQGWPPKPKP